MCSKDSDIFSYVEMMSSSTRTLTRFTPFEFVMVSLKVLKEGCFEIYKKFCFKGYSFLTSAMYSWRLFRC